MLKINLKDKPKFTRLGRAAAPSKPSIESKGGMFDAGSISGVSIITMGEALGHGVWLDQFFIDQVGEAFAAAGDRGVKSRFTHPGMSSDGLGKHLGRINNSRVEGNQVIGDLHFAKSAHSTPDGNLAEYVSSLVEEDPQAAGLSIVFHEDREAMVAFIVENGGEIKEDEYGEYVDLTNFQSPDPLNVNNYPHARLAELRAADLVDEPAANPDGMFDSMPVARNIDKALAFALGLENEKPDADLFGVDIVRATAFVGRFLSSRGLTIVTKTNESQKHAAEGITREQFAAELNKFTIKFGAENGVKWFNEGKSYQEGLELHIETLSAREKAANDKAAELQGKLDSLELGEKNPIKTGSAADADDKNKEKVPLAKATGAVK